MDDKNYTNFDSCEEVHEYLCSQFGDDTDSERCRAVLSHLEKCPDCARYCNSIEKMIGLYRAASPSFSEQAKEVLLKSLGIR